MPVPLSADFGEKRKSGATGRATATAQRARFSIDSSANWALTRRLCARALAFAYCALSPASRTSRLPPRRSCCVFSPLPSPSPQPTPPRESTSILFNIHLCSSCAPRYYRLTALERRTHVSHTTRRRTTAKYYSWICEISHVRVPILRVTQSASRALKAAHKWSRSNYYTRGALIICVTHSALPLRPLSEQL